MTVPDQVPGEVSMGSTVLRCRLCNHVHQSVGLRPGERALCCRCGALLGKRSRWGRDAALAFTLAGLAFSLPALVLPFVTASKLGSERVAHLFTGSYALWDGDMRLLALWVTLCGALAPVILLGTLAALLIPPKFRQPIPREHLLWRFAYALEHWAMPEVQVLAMLVAFTKLGALVNVTFGSGFWFYGAMSVATLLAWRSFEFGWPGSARELHHRSAAGIRTA